MRRSLAAASAAVVVGLLASLPGLTTAAGAQGAACEQAPRLSAVPSPPPGSTLAQSLVNPPASWAVSRGAGQLVAVLDTGVQRSALGGVVDAGVDLVVPGADATTDCDGRGTLVASLVNAGNPDALAYSPVAPSARILPVRVAEQASQPPAADVVAQGIRTAVARGATVVDVSFAVAGSTALADAVAAAQAANVVVVAAVGDDAQLGTPYPAAYPGVLAVAPTDQAGAATGSGPTGSFVRLAAPGAGITGLSATGGYLTGQGGAALAAAQAAGVVALVRAWQPSWDAATVVGRVEQTADAAAGPLPTTTLGFGLVDPYSALTAPVLTGTPSPTPTRRVDAALPPPDDPHTRYAAVGIAGAGLAAAVAAGAVVTGVRHARRRGWRPGRPRH